MNPADTPNLSVPEDEQRKVLLLLSQQCSSAAETFALAAQAVDDFELRAYFNNCSRLRNSIADEFFAAASKLQVAGTLLNESQGVIPVPSAANAATDDISTLAACRKSDESLAEAMRQALQMPLSPEPDAVVRKNFSEVVATSERLRSLEQSL